MLNLGAIGLYCKEADISPSVIVAIFSLTSFFVACLFFCLYRERLNYKHIMGMLMIMICVGFVTMSKKVREDNVLDDTVGGSVNEDKINAPAVRSLIIVPIFLGLLQCLNYTCTAFFLRSVTNKGYSAT